MSEPVTETVQTPEGGESGLTVEFVLLSVAIVSDKTSAGQFDDTCAFLIHKGLKEYHGVKSVKADVLYKHTKIETHTTNCQCHFCQIV